MLEKLWEEALGQASEENQDVAESQRIGEQSVADAVLEGAVEQGLRRRRSQTS